MKGESERSDNVWSVREGALAEVVRHAIYIG